MGAGIAESSSLARLPVLIRELPDYLAAARTRLEKSVDSAVKRGKLDADKRDAALARVTFTSELKDVAGSDLVVEAGDRSDPLCAGPATGTGALPHTWVRPAVGGEPVRASTA
jgi:hypothetical protein